MNSENSLIFICFPFLICIANIMSVIKKKPQDLDGELKKVAISVL